MEDSTPRYEPCSDGLLRLFSDSVLWAAINDPVRTYDLLWAQRNAVFRNRCRAELLRRGHTRTSALDDEPIPE